MLETLRTLVTEPTQSNTYECRRCGRTVDAETESCPDCGGGIAEYVVI